MVAKLDINALIIEKQMRLKLEKNKEQPALSQNLLVHVKRV